MHTVSDRRGERGVAMVMALLVLLVLSILAALVMMGVNTETKLAAHSQRHMKALNTAEAGIAEAVSRIRTGDIPNNLNPRMVAQVFNTVAGSVPVLGPDSVGLATAQPAGQWLNYSSERRGNDVLTVKYKTNPAQTVIYKYDASLNPPIQAASGAPIFVISSTGRQGNDVRRVEAEVILRPVNMNIKGALAADVDVKFTGNAVVCGHNHSADTPTNTGDTGRSGAGGCNENSAIQHWELTSGDKTGIWSTNDINNGGGAQSFGSPAEQFDQTGFYAGPWESLSMTQADFYQWLGPPLSTAPGNINGIIHLDNNSAGQDQSGSFAFHGGNGSGMLYVDGDLTLNSTFSYRGLIYVEGDLKLNGSAWVLGAIIVRGKAQLKNNGGATVLYSSDAISQNIAKANGQFVTLSWKDGP
jgi:Tfp pilus assembly protein PilX